MIRLLPNTDVQTIAVIPREFPAVDAAFDNISLTITEDGTNKSETITDIEATIPDSNSNFVYMDIAFSILSEENAYYLEFTKNSSLFYRDKAYVSSQTDDEIVHTLNTNKYDNYVGAGDDEYIVL
tara:strand:+ start:1259 stop:1633 length:375 start_codon:yes stop_codon:yes gene_type:complete